MTRRNWKLVRPNSAIDALRLCKEYAQEKKNLSIERIADRMGVTHDSLYKWLALGKLPFISLTAYEHACGCHFASEWAAASAGRVVIDMPTGRKVSEADLVSMNTSCAASMELLTKYYANPVSADKEATLSALRTHMEHVAFHQASVQTYTTPELEF
jgi:hypothetical protein